MYLLMALFIIAVNLLVLADRKDAERADRAKEASLQQGAGSPEAEKAAGDKGEKKPPSVFPGDEEVKARQEKLLRMAQDDPKLYVFFGLMNMMVLYIVLFGVIIDIYLVVKLIKRDPVRLLGSPPDPPKWSFGDVLRVVLIFLTSGYAFLILQAFVADRLPILYNDNFRMIFNTAMMNLVGISVIAYFVMKKHGQGMDSIGLTAKGMGRNIFYAVIAYAALIPVVLMIMVATYYVTRFFAYQPPVQPIVQVFMEEKQTMILWISALFAAIFGPVAEEIFFRGFMYPAVRKTLGVFWGMIITSAVFSLLHAHLVGFLPIFALGMLLVYLFEKTGSLVPSMAVHMIHNVAMVILVFVVRSIGV